MIEHRAFICDNPKAYEKVLLAFCRGNQFHANRRSESSSFFWNILQNKKGKSSWTFSISPLQTDCTPALALSCIPCACRCQQHSVCVCVFPSNYHDIYTTFFSISSPPFSTNYSHQLHPRCIVAVDSWGSNSSNLLQIFLPHAQVRRVHPQASMHECPHSLAHCYPT